MSAYLSRQRWRQRGYHSVPNMKERGPGFGRDVYRLDSLDEDAVVRKRCTTNASSWEEVQDNYLKRVLFLAPGVTFETASVDAVLKWASSVAGFDVLSSNINLIVLKEDFSLPDPIAVEKIERDECNLKETHDLSYEPQDDSDEDRLLALIERERKVLWKKLKILISAAFLARDDDEVDDSHELRRLRVESESTVLTEAGKSSSQTITPTVTTTVTRRRKLLLLYAAYFELCPQFISDFECKQIASPVESYSEKRRVMVREVFERSMRICPRDYIGWTPLAIAASASASIFPTSVFFSKELNESTRKSPRKLDRTYMKHTRRKITVERKQGYFSTGILTLSRRVIDRIIRIDSNAVKVPIFGTNQLPLHLAVQSGKDWEDGVSSIYHVHPEAVNQSDYRRWLPIHSAASSRETSPFVIKKLLKHNRKSAKVKDHDGRLPLHLATESCKTWETGVGEIFSAFPEAAIMPDSKGRLPAYYRFKIMNALASKYEEKKYLPTHHNGTTLVKVMLQRLVDSIVTTEERHSSIFPSFPSCCLCFFTNTPQIPNRLPGQ